MLRLPSERAWPATRLAFEFLILTATRSGETRGALWTEFDLDKALWTIPKERMKARRAHIVPLSRRCLAILRESRALNSGSELVFEGTKQGRPLSDMTFTKLLRDSGLGARATAHGFRSCFKVWCSEVANVADEVSEAALAHAIKDRVKAAYLRTDFLDRRIPLMEAWAQHCSEPCRQVSGRNLDIAVADQAA
jgi:integrase